MAYKSQEKHRRSISDKGQTILEVAARLFAERGFERTTTKMIATEAGVAEGTIFIYFPTKRDVLMALMEKLILQSLKHTLEETEGMSDRDVIHAIILGRLRLWSEHSGVLKAIIAQMFFDNSLAELFLTRVTGPAIEVMNSFITKRQHEGAFREIDASFAVRATIGQVIGLGIMSSIAPGTFGMEKSIEDYASRMTDMFLGGVWR